MKYSILVMSAPTRGCNAHTITRFVRALLTRGHQVERVFFLDDGTLAGNTNAVWAQDEANPTQLWADLQRDTSIELAVCVSSALKRGILDTTEADRYEKVSPSLHPAFCIAGLGQLIDALSCSDRHISFGGS